MKTYVVLIRGINVGGKNKVPMKELKACFEKLGFSDVVTYIASGNAVLKSTKTATQVETLIEKALPKTFKLDSKLVRVLALPSAKLKAVIARRPKGFGESPKKYHSDAIFLMGVPMTKAMAVFDPREGVDQIWNGSGVIYSQRLSAKRTKSRLSKIVGTKPYKSMTIRNWNTVTKLLELVSQK